MFLYTAEPIFIPGVCIFCFNRPPAGLTCTYGSTHEYAKMDKPKQIAKKDLQRCIKCDLHKNNPKSINSECRHEYSTV